MLIFDRDEFMKNPCLSSGKKIQKESKGLPNNYVSKELPDSCETHHTGKLFFLNSCINKIEEFNFETETFTDKIKLERSFSPIQVFGKEKLKNKLVSDSEILQDDLDFMFLSKSEGLYKKNDILGKYKKVIRTDENISSMILSNKHPEDPSKALIFCWNKIYYGKKFRSVLCGIPVKSNMLMRLYSDVYYIMNSKEKKWECRRIFFDEDFEDQEEHKIV